MNPEHPRGPMGTPQNKQTGTSQATNTPRSQGQRWNPTYPQSIATGERGTTDGKFSTKTSRQHGWTIHFFNTRWMSVVVSEHKYLNLQRLLF